MASSVAADIQSLERKLDIVDGTRRRGEVKNPLEPTADRDTVAKISVDQLESVVRFEVGHV